MKKYLCLVGLAGLLSVSVLCIGADASPIGNANAIESMVAQNRNIQFNGKPLTASGLATLQQLESYFGTQLADGTYWYDARTGAFGNWGGPTVGFLVPGLNLAGPLPKNASGGGTRVFINGREIHPVDLSNLQQMVQTQILPGRYFVEANGNAGYEGGPVMLNILQASQQNNRGNSSNGCVRSGGVNSCGSEGTSVRDRSDPTGKKSIDYYPGLGNIRSDN
jgi:hypothetical protein